MPVRAVDCLETRHKHVMAGAMRLFVVLFFKFLLPNLNVGPLGIDCHFRGVEQVHRSKI